MISAPTSNELHNHLSTCAINPPNLAECRFIKAKIQNGLISQVIFSYGGDTIVCILRLMEALEMYESCRVVFNAIEIHNKVNNTYITV